MDCISHALAEIIQSDKSSFVCGGEIPIAEAQDERAGQGLSSSDEPSSLPVILHWDHKDDQRSSKLVFPVADNHKESFERLIQDCEPATFGKDGKDVLDSSYRKATKLDNTQFTTSFCPHRLGIMDQVTQVLLPAVKGTHEMGPMVIAELYRLNIYQAPSGFFKSHVDTPRHETQFGSLVVCLPCDHTGGNLIVKHLDNEVNFDWGSTDLASGSIQWAAFYSDCEHKVLEVTKGHRITLTYNLYLPYIEYDRLPPGYGPALLNPEGFSLYGQVKEALLDSSFMPDGGTLGIFCTHLYAYNSDSCARGMPESIPAPLKGKDMAIFSVFKALDLPVRAKRVITHDSYDYDEREDITHPYVGPIDGGVILSNFGAEDIYEEDFLHLEFGRRAENVFWLNDKGPEDLGFVHLAYGNEASICHHYASAALMIDIPPFEKRREEFEDKKISQQNIEERHTPSEKPTTSPEIQSFGKHRKDSEDTANPESPSDKRRKLSGES